MVRPRLGGLGIPPRPARAGLHLHCATGFRVEPPTRARVRLLGPCFKTGRVGGRHRRRPRAPGGAPPRPAARRGRGALRTVRPGGQSRRERGDPAPAPRPPRRLPPGGGGTGSRRGEGAAAVISLDPGIRRELLPGGCNTRRAREGRRATCPTEAFPADPEPVAAHRLGGNAPDGGRGRPGGGPLPEPPSPRGGGGREGIRRPEPADRARRVESSGRTARTPPVYL